MKLIEEEGKILAIIIPLEFQKEGIEFFTPNEYSQQLAYMNRPKGYKIQAHTHKLVHREVINTLETLFIRKGKVKVDIYNENRILIKSEIVKTGDVIMLVSGGHGFEMLEDSEIIEVKQGPYFGEQDKIKY